MLRSPDNVLKKQASLVNWQPCRQGGSFKCTPSSMGRGEALHHPLTHLSRHTGLFRGAIQAGSGTTSTGSSFSPADHVPEKTKKNSSPVHFLKKNPS